MNKKSLHIKNMVCPRCITAVEQILTRLDIPYSEVKLGEAIVENYHVDDSILDNELRDIGFELIQDKHLLLSEKIKTIIVDVIHHNKEIELNINFSELLSNETKFSYSYLSRIFSETENSTIEKFIILQKIERVKELITYHELNFSEIALALNYSSAAHLSKQFKEIVGYSMSDYKNKMIANRKTIDDL